MRADGRPRKIVAVIYDDGTRRDVADIGQLSGLVDRLEREWSIYELGGNPQTIVPVLDAIASVKEEEVRHRNKANAKKPRKRATKKLTKEAVQQFMQEWQRAHPGQRGSITAAAVQFHVSEKTIKQFQA